MVKWMPRPQPGARVALASAWLLAACPTGEAASGNPTGAVCDPQVRYEADIMPLVAAYCTDCHAADLTADQRHGAPLDHNLDSEIALIQYPLHVMDFAGAGPLSVNTAMPPEGSPQPTVSERHKLAAFLTCFADGGVPEHPHDGGGH